MLTKKQSKVVDEKVVQKFIAQRNKDNAAAAATTRRNLIPICVKLDEDIYNKVVAASNKLGVTRSAFIKSAIASALYNGISLSNDTLS